MRCTVRPKKYAHGLCCVLAERRSGLQRFAVYGSRVGLCSPVSERHLLASGDTNNAPGVRVTPSISLRLVLLSVICFRIIQTLVTDLLLRSYLLGVIAA